MFFKESKKDDETNDLTKIAALLIHAARIDESYTSKEEEIIKKTLLEIGVKNQNLEKIIQDAKDIEKNSNQILDFTKKVKNMDQNNKIKIVETLWRIIYSNKDADMYETSLMRRLEGLLYIDSRIMGDIKDKIKKNS